MPYLTILKQALSILLWLIVHDFLQATKINCQNVTFSPMQTRWSSPMKTMQGFKFIAFVNIFFFLQTRDRKKKIVLNIEQWKNEGKVMWNLSEFVKTFMITQNKGEWPTSLALASVTQHSSNKSSNQIYWSLVMILSLKISLWQF